MCSGGIVGMGLVVLAPDQQMRETLRPAHRLGQHGWPRGASTLFHPDVRPCLTASRS
jgi:hypothetical protein